MDCLQGGEQSYRALIDLSMRGLAERVPVREQAATV
jgi:hypothetical protein